MSNGWREYRSATVSGGAVPVAGWLGAGVLAVGLLGLIAGPVDVLTGLGTGFPWQAWRVLTYPFTSYGLLGTLVTAVVIVAVGYGMESVLGRWQVAASYLLSGLGAGVVVSWLVPYSLGGATAALLGLIATGTALKLRQHGDIRGDVILLSLLVGFSLVSGSNDWVADLGGIAVGAVCGQVLARSGWRDRERRQRRALGVVAAVCAALIGASWLV